MLGVLAWSLPRTCTCFIGDESDGSDGSDESDGTSARDERDDWDPAVPGLDEKLTEDTPAVACSPQS
jgi:hypothetical protein